MTDDGSLFDEDAEWVTNVPDDDQEEEAADQLERATNLARTSGSSVYNSPQPETVMTLNDWWDLGIEGQLVRHLLNGADLPEAVGRLRLHPYYPSKNVFDDWSTYKDGEDLMRGHLYNQLTETKEYRVGDRIQGRASLREKLRIESMSGSTLNRAEDIMDDDVSGYDAAELLNEAAEAAIRELHEDGVEVEDLRAPIYPETISDGEGEYPLTLILRDLRKKTYPYIRFNRDKSVTHSKDMLLRVLASAARDYVHLTTAADGLKYKHWLDEDDIPSRWTLGYHLRKVALEGWDEDDEEDEADSSDEAADDEAEEPDAEARQLGLDELEDLDEDEVEELEFRGFYEVIEDIRDMFLAANQELHDIIAEHGYYDGQHAVAFDTTDVLFRGDPKTLGASGTKATRNASHAWQFISCSLVGADAPAILMSELVKTSGDKAAFLKRALWMADTMMDVDRAYLDSGFYNEDSARALSEVDDLGWVMQAKQSADKIDEMMDYAIENEKDWRATKWGVSDVPARHNLWVMESEKKSKLYKEKPDDPKDKWIAFYTNIDWVADDPDEEIDLESLTEEQEEMPLTPLELADDFRARWGIETSYRKLKEDFLAKSRSTRYYIRVQVFYFAVLWYNMWLAANVKRADELGINLGDDDEDYPFRGPEVMRAIEEDPTDLQIGETNDLSGIQKQHDAMNPWATFED
jgi:hypothetical protein